MNSDKILNPETGRYVLKTGIIGKKILEKLAKVKKVAEPKVKKVAEPKVKKVAEPKLKKVAEPKVKKVAEPKVKEININDLKNEWNLTYKTTKQSLSFNINSDKDNFLDIKLSKTLKIIGIYGPGTLILRKIKDIALANRENTEIYLPKNFTGRYYANPLWNKTHGYMYYLNDDNLKNISRIVETINLINKRYKSYKLSEGYQNNANKTHGIIGIDIPYNESKWVSELVKGNPLQNPILNENKQIIFGKCAISTKTIEKANIYLNKKSPNKFNLLYPKYINLRSTKTLSPLLDAFIKSDYKIANIAYDRHARTIFKSNNKLIIIDPWKQVADAGTKNLMKLISNLEFIKRVKEQTNEGSCTAVSYARTLYMAAEGTDKLHNNIPLDYIVLASRLISKFRS
jgi:hypothetical protein